MQRPRAVHACGALRLVDGLGVSLWARRHTTQVMLGLSLRVRWDTTLASTASSSPGRGTGKILVIIICGAGPVQGSKPYVMEPCQDDRHR